jgi:hypothetical protein
MSRLEFKKKELVIKWDGGEYILSYPNVADGKRFSESIENKNGKEIADAIIDFLDILGLPKKVALEMYEEDIVEIFNTIRGEKKSNQK